MKLTFKYKGKRYSTTNLGFAVITSSATILAMVLGIVFWTYGVPFLGERFEYLSCKEEISYIFNTYDTYSFTVEELPTEYGNACQQKYGILAVGNTDN